MKSTNHNYNDKNKTHRRKKNEKTHLSYITKHLTENEKINKFNNTNPFKNHTDLRCT